MQIFVKKSKLTLEVALGSEVANGESKYGEAIEFAKDILLERQQGGKGVQLCVEPFPVSFAWVTLRNAIFGWWFDAGKRARCC